MKIDGQEELIEFLMEIDNRVRKVKPKGKINIFVFGGAAAVLGYGTPRGTMDLDVHLEYKAIELKLLEWAGPESELEKKYGIYLQSANLTLMAMAPDWTRRSKEILKNTFQILRVLALGKEDLILSKLSRYNDRDRFDIQFIIENCAVEAKTLIKYYSSARLYYVGNLQTLDFTFNIILKEHFGKQAMIFKI